MPPQPMEQGPGFGPPPSPSPQRPASRARRALTALTAVLVTGVVSAGVVAYLALAQWLDPSTAALYAVIATIPSLGVGFLVGGRSGGGFNLAAAIRGILSGAVGAALCGSVAAAWMLPAVRQAALPFASMSEENARRVLADPADAVALAGCGLLLDRLDSPDWRNLLMSQLTLRPDLARGCLPNAEPDVAAAVAQSLSDRWTRELTSGLPTEDDRGCEVASGLASLPLDRADLDTRLLYCLAAGDPGVQKCCGDALVATAPTAEQWVSHLRDTIGRIRSDAVTVAVYSMAFHQHGLTPSQKGFADAVKFQDKAARQVALEFACDSIAGGKVGAIRHLAASLDGTCDLDVARIDMGRQTWFEICTSATDEAPRREPVEALCDAAHATLLRTAIRDARTLVAGSIKSPEKGKEAASEIDEGWSIVNEFTPTTKEELRALVPKGTPEDKVDDVMRAFSLSPVEYGGNPLLMGPTSVD